MIQRFTPEQAHQLKEFARIGREMLLNKVNQTDDPVSEATEYQKKEKKASKTPSTEKETQAKCLKWLSEQGIFHYRQNSGAFMGQGGGMYQIGVKGAPDIIIVRLGRFVGVEVKDKKPSAKQSPSQIKFQKELEAAGGVYLLIRDVEELKRFLNENN